MQLWCIEPLTASSPRSPTRYRFRPVCCVFDMYTSRVVDVPDNCDCKESSYSIQSVDGGPSVTFRGEGSFD